MKLKEKLLSTLGPPWPPSEEWLILATLIILAAAPWLASSYRVGLLNKFILFGIFAISLDLMWGYAGILSFGHAAFFGLGAYAMGLSLKHWEFSGVFYVGIFIAIGLSALVAVVLGYFLFYGRVSGPYFAIVTLVVSLIFQQVAITWINFTGGDNGLYPIPPLTLGIPGLLMVPIEGREVLYFVALVAAALTYFICRRLVLSPFGRALKALKDNEERLEFLGYHVASCRVLVFVFASAMAALAGAIYAPTIGFVSPDLLGLLVSTEVIIWVAVGGRATLVGPLIGAILVSWLEAFLSGVLVNIWLLLLGLFFIGVVIFRPEGLLGFLSRPAGVRPARPRPTALLRD